METVDFFAVDPQPCPMHLHRVQPRAQPHLPSLCRQGGSFQVDFVACILSYKHQSDPLHLHFVFLRHDLTDFYANPGPTGIEFRGPMWQPIRAVYNLTAWNMFILVPIFYRAIFKFRKVQDLTAGKDFIGPYTTAVPRY